MRPSRVLLQARRPLSLPRNPPLRRAKQENVTKTTENAASKGVRPVVMTVTALGMFALSAYGSYLYTTYRQARAFSSKLSVDSDVSDRYRTTAGQYDSDVDLAERTMRMGKRRRELIQRARGHVLEVSAGTGRNLPYYMLGERRGVDKQGKAAVLGCRSVTFIDLWPEMVDIARWKYEAMGSNREKGKAEVVFLAQDAMGEVTSPEGTKFDTVVQTMGLCSHPEPVKLLRHLGELLVTGEEGRILLLEHGRGHYGWLNGLLDGLAAAHADRHGCWWNRDIGEIEKMKKQKQKLSSLMECMQEGLGLMQEEVLSLTAKSDLSI
ncbi:TPA_exp: Mitochondrial methyltransferase [Trichophyton benhamiae CBS 112371]|nr:TPA_exp: Mitochondrial methyltransferase [Trichophyton benhamiae CBS 112371]